MSERLSPGPVTLEARRNQALFAFLLWRELDSGRMTPGDLLRGAFALLLVLGAVGLGLLLLAGLIYGMR